MTIAELKVNLATIRQAIEDVVKTGKSYQIVGSHSVTNLTLSELREEEDRIIKQILRKAKYKPYTL
jgi:hypothetical protein